MEHCARPYADFGDKREVNAMSRLVIFGATELAKLVRHYAEQELGFDVQGFAVDEQYKNADEFDSLPVFGWQTAVKHFPVDEVAMFVAVGYSNMRGREAAYTAVKQFGYSLVNLVCKSSYVASGVVMGDNNIVMPGVVIEPGVTLGSNNVVWSNATICHDGVVGDHNFIAANTTLGGGVYLGNRNFLGFSSVVLQERRIGNETLIGAQALVNRNTQDLSVYQGSPARRARGLDPKIGVAVAND
ncbi:NeuD/PglB/VioB family sugar acetyltransferase [Paraburkholderia domus]|uniref:NeuD/PglB/VioB family sugar acetyltransferase n=1 Tax=Paraburkholderia domus TaxID=2793075 RepID=UPI001EF0FE4C|nr:NeuD/PglB/VioB family sugar acetyltransferase [Paraburkholderia domus]